MSYRFVKGHGTENDFVVVPGDVALTVERVRALCDRRAGIGGDGVIGAVQRDGRWFMDYRNADGSKAEMCGNGTRVFAKYLLDSGLATIEPGSTLPIGTRAGIKDLTRSAQGFQVDLGRWKLESAEPLVRTRGMAVARPGLSVNLGNPHVVVALASNAELDDLDLAVIPHLDPAPAAGANVEFVVPEDPMIVDGVGHLRMRVFERGVGETLSCGTGIAAAALAVRHWAGPQAPHNWRVEVPGGVVAVRMFPTEEGEHVALSGPASLVFSGTISLA